MRVSIGRNSFGWNCKDLTVPCCFGLDSIGIHQRPGDLEVNVCKTKALNNIRSATKEMKTGVIPPIDMSLDACVEYIATDEILEVTPSLYRMAKNPDLAKKAKGVKK